MSDRQTGRLVRELAVIHPDWRITDCALPNDLVCADVEIAYRRGFAHGMAASIGQSRSLLERWQVLVGDWRAKLVGCIKGEPVRAVSPPGIPR